MADKKLVRSRTNRWLAGVCGGLAVYFGVDATLVRLVFIVASLVFGVGLLPYVILWVVMPAR